MREGVSILIQKTAVPFIIGKSGKQIKHFQDLSCAEISVQDKKQGVDYQHVKIIGRGQDIEMAVEHMLKLIQERTSPEPQSVLAIQNIGKCCVRFLVPKSSAGYFIGKEGQFIKSMKTEFKVDVKLLHDDRRNSNNTQQIAVVLGSYEDCRSVIPKFIDRICYALHADNDETMVILLAKTSACSKLTTNFLRDCQKATRTTIKVLYSEIDSEIRITGPLHDKYDVALGIFERLESSEVSTERSPRLKTERSRRESAAVSVTVPDYMVARLIGKNGKHVKNMIDASECSMFFHKEPEGVNHPTGDIGRLCTLKGIPRSIAAGAKLLLEEILKLEKL